MVAYNINMINFITFTQCNTTSILVLYTKPAHNIVAVYNNTVYYIILYMYIIYYYICILYYVYIIVFT